MWHRESVLFGRDGNRPTWKGKWKQQKEVDRIVSVLHIKPPREDRESYRCYIETWGEYARIKEADDRVFCAGKYRNGGF